MSTPRTRTSRDAFIGAAGVLLRRQGYAATGLNEIVERSGAPKGSLYFHFPGGKEQLAVAAMKDQGERLRSAITATLAADEDLGQALGNLLDALAAGLQSSGYRDGCPIATITLEAAADSGAVRAAADEIFQGWLAELQARLLHTGLDAQSSRRRAMTILASIEGALILARAQQDVEPLHAVAAELREQAARTGG